MLRHLAIKNIAVIDTAELLLDDGCNILTGETGAGKSIIIDALGLLCGSRTSRELIRTGEKSARVDGLFCVKPEVAAILEEQFGITAEDNELLVSREITADGRNTVRVGGTVVTAAMLRDIGSLLVSIHGQHDNTSLLQKKTHIRLLDAFGGADLAQKLAEYQGIHSKAAEIAAKLQTLHTDEQEQRRRADMLSYQVEEIELANLQPDEEETLQERRAFLANAQHIANAVESAYAALYEGGEGGASAHDLLWEGIKQLETVAEYDRELSELHAGLSDVGYTLTDAVRTLKRYCDSMTVDDGELEQIEDRLDVLYNLKRKYGATIGLVLEFAEKARAELDTLVHADAYAAELEQQFQQLEARRKQAAAALTAARRVAAKQLEENIAAELADLDMKKVAISVQMTPSEYHADGADDVEFLIRTNVGEDLRPLSKIASGGELSRIMLAMKSVLHGGDVVDTLIFDEVDAGVSGRAAQKLGEKLYAISRRAQVVCITHLPQVAALADTHFLIEKQVEDGRTRTHITPLADDGRARELARSLGGAQITDLTIQNAQELMKQAQEVKTHIREGF